MWPFKKTNPLDRPLYRWNKQDALTVRNLLAGGIHAFGRTDGGKTSSMVQIARAIMKHGNSSMLILCPKRDEYREWVTMANRCGRRRDVIVVDPSHGWRFNMVGWEAQRKGQGAGIASNVTRFLMELRSVVFRESEQVGGESQQWKKQDERLITNAVIMLQLAGEPINPANLHRFIMDAPQNTTVMADAQWQAGYCNQIIARAFRRRKSATEQGDYEISHAFFTQEWPSMASRTRSSIATGTMATLFTLNIGIVRELFATKTNFTPAKAIENRWIVIVNMPPDEYGSDAGGVANVGLKFHWQKEILRRRITNRSPICCIWGDESSLWVTPSDAGFLSRCRSYRGCMVYLCQSLNSYREALPGDKADAAIKSMLGNFSHKLFFALGDYETAEWASNLCGKELRQFTGGGVQHAAYDPMAFVQQPGGASSSFHEQYAEVIQPGEFMNGLRTGSPVNRFQVDAVLVRSGVPFSNGLPVLDVTFDQRR